MEKVWRVVLLATAILAVQGHVKNQVRHGPLEGGREARSGEFPFAVALKNKYFEYCTGIILSPKHVITEAWCIDDASTMTVIAGCTDYYMDACKEYSIAKVSYHPNYTDIGVNDVAIVTVFGMIRMGELVKSIKISESFVDERKTAIALGWDPWSSKLRWNDVKVLPTDYCDGNWGWGQPGAVICTEPAELINERAGDFGFQLIADNFLVGIPVESSNVYDVYQRLSKYVDWIKSVVNS